MGELFTDMEEDLMALPPMEESTSMHQETFGGVL